MSYDEMKDKMYFWNFCFHLVTILVFIFLNSKNIPTFENEESIFTLL